MIKTVIRFQDAIVVVFDERGEQIPEYQGRYEEVRESILRDAPPEARFCYFPGGEVELKIVPRDEW